MYKSIAMKISQQLRGAAIGIFVIGSSSLASVYLNSLGNDSKVVNYTGIVRGGTQRLVKLELAGKPSDAIIEKQDKLVDGLINGDPAMGLPAATDPAFRQQMELVATAWKDLKQKIVAVRENKQTSADLLAASERYFELADRAVSAAEKYSTDKTTQLRTIQLLVFGASLILLISIWMTVNKITNILKSSTSNITNSFDRISATIGEQEKSVNQQAQCASKATDLMGSMKDLTEQSKATIEMSMDRVTHVVELLKKTQKYDRQQVAAIFALQEKLRTIANCIESLDKQTVKISKAKIASAPALTTANRVRELQSDRNKIFATDLDISAEEFTKLLNNLQSSIAAVAVVTNDSNRIIEERVTTLKENTFDLSQASTAIDFLSLNERQSLTTAKQYASAVQQVISLIEVVNAGAKETTNSISQIRLSAGELGETTQALEARI
jgi:methyl-accepting chemotaxis protein